MTRRSFALCACGFAAFGTFLFACASNLQVIKLARCNYSVPAGSENPASPSSAVLAQRARVLPAASLRTVSGPGVGLMDVSPPQASLRPRRPKWGERPHPSLTFIENGNLWHKECRLSQPGFLYFSADEVYVSALCVGGCCVFWLWRSCYVHLLLFCKSWDPNIS